jgi:hypothetical protein
MDMCHCIQDIHTTAYDQLSSLGDIEILGSDFGGRLDGAGHETQHTVDVGVCHVLFENISMASDDLGCLNEPS